MTAAAVLGADSLVFIRGFLFFGWCDRAFPDLQYIMVSIVQAKFNGKINRSRQRQEWSARYTALIKKRGSPSGAPRFIKKYSFVKMVTCQRVVSGGILS
jgi:hypothetical protein